MESNLGAWSVVIVGNWNRMIFRPEWIGGGRLTDITSINIELPINNPTLPPRYIFDDIILRVTFQRLSISPQNEDPDTLSRMQEVAIRILRELPHTPVSGIGVNFEFVEREPSPEILNIFNFSDLMRLSDEQYIVNQSNITRKLIINGQIINLRHQLDENSYMTIGFNFHRDITNTDEGIDFLGTGILRMRDQANSILERVYNLAI
jgi:hypothetical protein